MSLERRLLWHSLHVDGDAQVVEHLEALLPDAHHPVPARRALHYQVTASSHGFTISEEGDALAMVTGGAHAVEDAADLVHVRAHRRAFELASLSGWARVHAATVDLDDVRVLVRRGESLAVPRALHLKPGTDRILPELADVLATLPVVGEVTVLDPARVGRPVALRLAPVTHVVLLADRSSPTGPVTCTPVDGGAVLEALLTDAFPLTETKARMVSVLAGAMVTARGHRLTSGPPVAMVEALHSAIR